MSQQFGGSWTDQKMKMVVDYTKAYLTIMSKFKWAKTIYFDGFAGSGIISGEHGEAVKKGTALQVLEITNPKPFDMYYFVELKERFKNNLDEQIKKDYPGRKNCYVVQNDCNTKLIDLAKYLTENKNYRALAFVDPYGMDSGRQPRPMDEEWVLDILDQCKAADVKFFFKQWGGTNKKKSGRMLLDRTWDDMPY